jgi:hypothetical protein
MVKEARRIKFEELAADLSALLERIAAEDKPVIVEKDGHLYRIEATAAENEVPRARPHDPGRFRQMLQRTTGALKGVDIEALKRDLRAGREQIGRNYPQ